MQDYTTPEIQDWESLLKAARDGDEGALNVVWTQLRSYMLLMAGGVGDPMQGKMDASDIVQQSLMEAHEDFKTFRGQSESEIRSWLGRLVQHNLIDARRHYKATRQRDITRETSLHEHDLAGSIPGADKTASSLVRRKELDEQLLRAVDRLPERSQQALELRHRQGLSHAEVGQELGMTEDAARKLWSRTVEQLRIFLTPRHAESPTQS